MPRERATPDRPESRIASLWRGQPLDAGIMEGVPTGCVVGILLLLFAITMVALMFVFLSSESFDAAPPTDALPPSVPGVPTSIPVVDLSAPVTVPAVTSATGEDPGDPPPASTATAPDPVVFPDLVPVTGAWSFDNLPGLVDCGSVQVPLEGVTESGRLTVSGDGGEIFLEGFGEGTSAISLARSLATPFQAVYSGMIDPLVLGDDVATGEGTFAIELTVVFESPTQMTANLTGTVESEGFSCSVQRVTTGALTGGEGGTVLDVVGEAPPAVANCDLADTTPIQSTPVPSSTPAPTSHAALGAFLEAAEPPPPVTAGFREFVTEEATYFVAFEGETPFVSIRVDSIAGGFAVTSWESGVC